MGDLGRAVAMALLDPEGAALPAPIDVKPGCVTFPGGVQAMGPLLRIPRRALSLPEDLDEAAQHIASVLAALAHIRRETTGAPTPPEEDRPMRTQNRTHLCPGGCGDQVLNKFYACRADWFRLPLDLRRPINNNRAGSPEHRQAMGDAAEWYAANRRAGVTR